MGYNGGLNQHSINGGSEKWSDPWYFMKTEPTRLPDELDVGCERRVKSISKVWGLRDWKDRVAISVGGEGCS